VGVGTSTSRGKNQADFVAQNFTGFKWILGYSTSR